MVLPLGGRVGRRQLKYTVQAPGISLRPGLRRFCGLPIMSSF